MDYNGDLQHQDWAKELAAFEILFANGYEKYDMNAITGTSMHWMTPLKN